MESLQFPIQKEKETSSELVPFIDLPAQFRSLKQEIEETLAPIFTSAGFIMGPAVSEFENDFAKYVGAEYCITLHSGTAALHLALLALGIGPGDEVITAANSFVATAEGIAFSGARTRLVDVDPRSYNLDPTKLEEAITPKTKAIIPVHLYGQSADMDPILEIAKKHGLKVIEDACQAHGALYKGRRVGTFSDVSCFSFYPGKNLGAAGEGGAIVTNSADIAERVKLLRDHGSKKKYEHEIVGHNFRLDTIQAAILKIKLKYLDSWNKLRRQHAEYYRKNLQNCSALVLPEEQNYAEHIFHLFVVQTGKRAEIQAALSAVNIQSGIHYPVPIHLQKAFRNLGYHEGDFPVSEQCCQKLLSLPMFPELTQAQMDRVIGVLRRELS